MNRTDLPLPNPMMLPFGLQQMLENELDKGEILLWLEMRAAKSERIQAWVAIDDLDLLRQNSRLNSQNFVRIDDAEGGFETR